MTASRAWLEKDFYKVLGVSQGASRDEIKRAYRTLARTLHPDRNPGDRAAEERMKEVAEAYDVLSDDKKRAEYDQVRRMGAGAFGGGFGGGRGGFGGGVDVGDLSDLFGGIFGGGRRGARTRSRSTAEATGPIVLSFEDAAHGATARVGVRHDARCSGCGGSGDRSGRAEPCVSCGGTGAVNEAQGMFSFMRPCPVCEGSGRHIRDRCGRCGGSGVERRTDTVNVRVPAGIEDGKTLRVRVPGSDASVLVPVRVERHPLFGRNGADLTLTVPLSFARAALGTTVEVPTLNGPVTLKVPGGTQPGKVMRVRGKGIARPRGGQGDLLVTIQVTVPEKLSREERELIEKLAEVER